MREPEVHEAAGIFPLDEATIPGLAEDIKKHGQRDAIVLVEGKILDGRRRLRACRMAGVEPRFEDRVTDDPIALSWSLNAPRRHLNASQLSMAAARRDDMYVRQAQERKLAGNERGGEASGAARRGETKSGANLPPTSRGPRSRDEAGKAAGVGGRSVQHARKVLKDGVPELIAAVEEGRMAVSSAAVLTAEREEVQRAEAARAKRRYGSQRNGTKPPEGAKQQEPRRTKSGPRRETDGETEANPTPGLRGVGCHWAREAINCLIRIPRDDPQRHMARKLLKDWIQANL